MPKGSSKPLFSVLNAPASKARAALWRLHQERGIRHGDIQQVAAAAGISSTYATNIFKRMQKEKILPETNLSRVQRAAYSENVSRLGRPGTKRRHIQDALIGHRQAKGRFQWSDFSRIARELGVGASHVVHEHSRMVKRKLFPLEPLINRQNVSILSSKTAQIKRALWKNGQRKKPLTPYKVALSQRLNSRWAYQVFQQMVRDKILTKKGKAIPAP